MKQRPRVLGFAFVLLAPHAVLSLSIRPSAAVRHSAVSTDAYDRRVSNVDRDKTHCWHQEVAVACAIGTSLLLSDPASIIFTSTLPPPALAVNIDMTFENGRVQLGDPLNTFASNYMIGELRQPQFLGSGAGGSVFSYNRAHTASPVVVKVSWERSTASVERECEVLKYMQESRHRVTGVEICLGRIPYPNDARRTMIVMEPFMDDSVASVSEIRENLRPYSVRCIVRTLVQMLGAGVVTTDIQPLISRSTGEVVFIDMTEAKIISRSNMEPLTFLDMALASSFCSEMLGLVPEEYGSIASEVLVDEVKMMGPSVPRRELLELIQGQATFLSRDALAFIEARIYYA